MRARVRVGARRRARARVTRGDAANSAVADPISHGTTAENVPSELVSSSAVPTPEPTTQGATR